MIKIIRQLEEHRYAGRFRIGAYLVEMPDGKQTTYYIRQSQPFAIVIPVLDNGDLVMVTQHRIGAERTSLEFPMGEVAGKDADAAAPVELKEETGYTADRFERIAEFYLSPGWSTQVGRIFVATGLSPGEQELEEFEHIEVEIVSPSRIPSLLADGTIFDASTIVAWTYYASHASLS
jgi:ADP-ribose pyrophosphatase